MVDRLRLKPRPREIAPVMLIAVAIMIFWSFGVESVGRRLVIELDGVVIARQQIPRTWSKHGTGMTYVVRGADGVDRPYVAGGTDASLPRDIPIGTYLQKRKWELSYFRNGSRIDDFPRLFYSGLGGIALACLLGATLQLVRRHD